MTLQRDDTAARSHQAVASAIRKHPPMLGRHEGSPATVCLALGVHLAPRALAAGWQPRVRRLVGFGRDHPPRVRPGAQLDRASVAGNDSLARNRSCDPPGPALELERNTAYMGEAAAPITAFPFVGRDDEMGVLEAALLAAENRLGALVLIAGEPGVGRAASLTSSRCERRIGRSRSCAGERGRRGVPPLTGPGDKR